jgi:hypothetical protein
LIPAGERFGLLTRIGMTESGSSRALMISWLLFLNSRGWFPPIFWQLHNANEAAARWNDSHWNKPHRWGRKVFEAPDVEPVFPEKRQAIDYAETRACFRSGEIRVLDVSGKLDRDHVDICFSLQAQIQACDRLERRQGVWHLTGEHEIKTPKPL